VSGTGPHKSIASASPSPDARIEIVQNAIDAFNRGDLDAMLELSRAEDFVYDWSRGLGPNRGIYEGAGGFREFVHDQWSTFEDVRVEVHEIVPRGRHVIVTTTTHGRGRQGIPVRAKSTHLYTFDDDRLKRITLHQDRDEALAAAGESA
jgi:ketosteroid isomerase-like protein